MLSKVPRPNISSARAAAPQETSNVFDAPRCVEYMITANPAETQSWGATEFEIAAQEVLFDNYDLWEFTSADPLNTVFSDFDNIDWVRLEVSNALNSYD